MAIPTSTSLHGVIVGKPRLTVIGKGPARHFASVLVRHEAPPDWWGGSPKATQHDLVMYGDEAVRAHALLRDGDAVVASGYVDEYEYDGQGLVEEFVAEQIGHDLDKTHYTVDRRPTRRGISSPTPQVRPRRSDAARHRHVTYARGNPHPPG